MSNDRRTAKKSERHKLLLIPALAGVLLYVLLGSGDSTEPPPEVAPDASTAASAAPIDDQTPPLPAVPAWPEHPLEHILAHDPFLPHDAQALTADAMSTEPVRLEPKANPAERIRGLRVSAIFRGPQGMMAVVDGRTVRVGDELAGGLLVTRIDADGVEVALQASSAGSEGPD